MTTPTCWRPSTGADSVPYPTELLGDGCDHDSPEAKAIWARYWRDREEAAKRETADEAIARCRAEADQFEHGAARFELVLDTLTDALDRHVADLAGREGDRWYGMGFEESTFVGFGQADSLAHAQREMAEAWDRLDRDAYRKAAAKFANAVADLSIGMMPTAATGKGGAA